MTDSEVFIKAAELVDFGMDSFCCIAIDRVLGRVPADGHSELAWRFWYKCFRPSETRGDTWESASFNRDHQLSKRESRRAERVLALCFAAAMAETGDI